MLRAIDRFLELDGLRASGKKGAENNRLPRKTARHAGVAVTEETDTRAIDLYRA